MEHYHNEGYDNYSNPEALRTLEDRWRCGLLNDRITCWKNFLYQHWDHIHLSLGPARDDFMILETTKSKLKALQFLDLKSENEDQTKAIQVEVWIRGERGEYDKNRIYQEWAKEHAPKWRRWRIQENLYVADKVLLDLYYEVAAELGQRPGSH